MSFRPVNNDHSIEAFAIAIVGSAPWTPAAIQAISDQHEKWRKRLPAKRTPQTAAIEITQGAQIVSRDPPPAVSFAFFEPDGQSAWELNVVESQVALVCRLYTRWSLVWTEAAEILQAVVGILCQQQANTNVQEIIFEFLDTFIQEGEAFDAKSLLRNDAAELASRVFTAGSAWHVHVGWFTDWSSQFRRLEQLNVDVKPHLNMPAVKIQHVQRLRPTAPVQLNWITGAAGANFGEAVGRLHKENLETLRRLLVPEILKKIGAEK